VRAEDVARLPHGLYMLDWTEEQGGGFSLAAVGSFPSGERWFAPTNWVSLEGGDWAHVANARLLVAERSVRQEGPSRKPYQEWIEVRSPCFVCLTTHRVGGPCAPPSSFGRDSE
jgi:hypothetical protein